MSRVNVTIGSSATITWYFPAGSDDYSTSFQEDGCSIHIVKPNSDIDEASSFTLLNSNAPNITGYIKTTKTIDQIGVWRFYFEYDYINSHNNTTHKCYEEILIKCVDIKNPSANIPISQI